MKPIDGFAQLGGDTIDGVHLFSCMVRLSALCFVLSSATEGVLAGATWACLAADQERRPSLRVNVVHLGGDDQGIHEGHAVTVARRSGEEPSFSAEGNATQGVRRHCSSDRCGRLRGSGKCVPAAIDGLGNRLCFAIRVHQLLTGVMADFDGHDGDFALDRRQNLLARGLSDIAVSVFGQRRCFADHRPPRNRAKAIPRKVPKRPNAMA